MKKLLLLSMVTWGTFQVTHAQDCSGNRYYQPIFTDVTEQTDVTYGSNLLQDETTVQDLKMDIYMPTGDTDTDRPLIVFAHGGSFIGGSKADVADQCRAFAKMGYVAVGIQYRLLSVNTSVIMNPGLEFQKEVVRAVHDMRAAIRYFRKSVALDGNPYGINPNLIIVGGVSAGAILSNHVAYFDNDTKIPSILTSYVSAQGGLEGTSGTPGYNSVPQMVVSFCGAIADTAWIESGDQPIVGVHNTDDNVVPNLAGNPNVGISIPVTLYGDSLIYKRTLTTGVVSDYMSVNSSGHCVFPPEAAPFVTDFMHNQICVQGLSLAENPNNIVFSVYPNPAKETFFVDVPSNSWNWEITIINPLGQIVSSQSMNANQNLIQIESSNFESGIYLVRLNSQDGKEVMKRIVIQ